MHPSGPAWCSQADCPLERPTAASDDSDGTLHTAELQNGAKVVLPEVLTLLAAVLAARFLLGEFTRQKAWGDEFLSGYSRILDECTTRHEAKERSESEETTA